MIVTFHSDIGESCYFKLDFGHVTKFVRVYRDRPELNARAIQRACIEARRDAQ